MTMEKEEYDRFSKYRDEEISMLLLIKRFLDLDLNWMLKHVNEQILNGPTENPLLQDFKNRVDHYHNIKKLVMVCRQFQQELEKYKELQV